MSKLLYRFGIKLYALLIRLVAPFHKKARAWAKGRKAWASRLEKQVQAVQEPIIWFHCASLGEFEQGRPLMERVKEEFPDTALMVTFFSPSGYNVRHDDPIIDIVSYLPLDTRSNAQKFLEITQPATAFFVKYEYWLNFLDALWSKHIPVFLVAAAFREDQVFFKWYGRLFREALETYRHIFVQNEESKQLALSLGCRQVSVSGDTRFDRVAQTVKKSTSHPVVEQFKKDEQGNNRRMLVVGSSWPEDMHVLAPFINKTNPTLKIVIAPHEVEEDMLKQAEDSLQVSSIRYSQASVQNVADKQILLIDNIGMLALLYRYADFAYVGGAFGKGLHNILEAAAFGIPLFFGPYYQHFPEARDLVKKGGAFSVDSTMDFTQQFLNLYKDPDRIKSIRRINLTYMKEQQGATDKTFRVCNSIIKDQLSAQSS